MATEKSISNRRRAGAFVSVPSLFGRKVMRCVNCCDNMENISLSTFVWLLL